MKRKESVNWREDPNAMITESSSRKWIKRIVLLIVAMIIALSLARFMETNFDDGAVTVRFHKSSPLSQQNPTTSKSSYRMENHLE